MRDIKVSAGADCDSEEAIPRGLDMCWSPPRIVGVSEDVRPTPYRAGVNQFELWCGVCGKVYYADEQTFGRVKTAGRAGQCHSFVCEACEW